MGPHAPRLGGAGLAGNGGQELLGWPRRWRNSAGSWLRLDVVFWRVTQYLARQRHSKDTKNKHWEGSGLERQYGKLDIAGSPCAKPINLTSVVVVHCGIWLVCKAGLLSPGSPQNHRRMPLVGTLLGKIDRLRFAKASDRRATDTKLPMAKANKEAGDRACFPYLY